MTLVIREMSRRHKGCNRFILVDDIRLLQLVVPALKILHQTAKEASVINRGVRSFTHQSSVFSTTQKWDNPNTRKGVRSKNCKIPRRT